MVHGFNKHQGWGLLSQFSLFRYFPHFPLLSKHTLAIEYHVYIWQVSPQLSCGDTWQIWMWFKESNRYFCKIENFAYGKISERSFSNNPHPRSHLSVVASVPGEGTPSMLGDTYVPPFWPPFLTFWGLNMIFFGYFSHPPTPKRSFGVLIFPERYFWSQIPCLPRSFRVQFSAACGHPPTVFPMSSPPPQGHYSEIT